MLKERHLFALHHFAIYLGNCFWGCSSSLNWACGRLVGTTTDGALPVPLLLGALGYYVSHYPASKAPGNTVMWVRVMEDGHFNWSPSARREWNNGPDDPQCFYKGGSNWAVCNATAGHSSTTCTRRSG